jgi:poly [ADP-ribose] polymerase
MKTARLIYVEVNDGKTAQSNKYYNLTEQSNGKDFLAEWGRVGCSTPSTKLYPMYDWDTKYNEKIKKKYKDVTSLRAENAIERSIKNASREVAAFFNQLQLFSSNSVKANYTISSKDVTPQMVTEAQRILDTICNNKAQKIDDTNHLLLELYKVIPRKMKDVRSHLLQSDKSIIDKIIASEQDTLDSMAGQVNAQSTTQNDSEDLLEALGLVVSHVEDPKVIAMVKGMMGDKSRHFKKLFQVINKKTEGLYNQFGERTPNENLLWHGSRNQNWYNILQTGLLIRPSGAAYTGSMFGDAIYAASQCRKAMNYTSLAGSYWAKGNDHTAFMALFNFKLGKQKHIYKHDQSCYTLNWNKVNGDGFDSVHAHGGADLINDEFTIYRSDQCTVKYVIELNN